MGHLGLAKKQYADALRMYELAGRLNQQRDVKVSRGPRLGGVRLLQRLLRSCRPCLAAVSLWAPVMPDMGHQDAHVPQKRAFDLHQSRDRSLNMAWPARVPFLPVAPGADADGARPP